MSATPIDPSIGVTPLPMRFRKATKQLATLGPSSSSFEMIEKLFLSGKLPSTSPVMSLQIDQWRCIIIFRVVSFAWALLQVITAHKLLTHHLWALFHVFRRWYLPIEFFSRWAQAEGRFGGLDQSDREEVRPPHRHHGRSPGIIRMMRFYFLRYRCMLKCNNCSFSHATRIYSMLWMHTTSHRTLLRALYSAALHILKLLVILYLEGP